MKKTGKSTYGILFYNVTIKTTVNELKRVLGEPSYQGNDGKEKVNFDWACETEDGEVVTIYDWKSYKVLDLNEEIEFHLGGRSKDFTLKGKEELETLLKHI
jgi:hypothetical protein